MPLRIRALYLPFIGSMLLCITAFFCFGCDSEPSNEPSCLSQLDCSENEKCLEGNCIESDEAGEWIEEPSGVESPIDLGLSLGGIDLSPEPENCLGEACSCLGNWDCSPDKICLRTTNRCVPIECERDLDCASDSFCQYGLCLADTSQDRDYDGVPDAVDSCPDHINPDQEDLDRDGEGDGCDLDIDNDFVLNENDNCVYTANPDQSDEDRDGVGDLCADDIDGDGILNTEDNCPEHPNPPDRLTNTQRDLDGDLIGDRCDPDVDGDGIDNERDNCLLLQNPDQRDTDEDRLGDRCDPDIDNDRIRNQSDNCPFISNSDQADSVGRGIGDACNEDMDLDGIIEDRDNCPSVYNPSQSDLDQDGIGDQCDQDIDGDGIVNEEDLCPNDQSSDQNDLDGDGIGDLCDPDLDGDGISNISDNCKRYPNPDQRDDDQDGIGDACDIDQDSDGIPDDQDNCPGLYNGGQRDQDFDDLGDRCDADIDGDGFLNQDDTCPYLASIIQRDLDLDGIGDPCDLDVDGDEIPNEADNCVFTPNPSQEDGDEDGIGDLCDLDTDRDDVLDEVDNCRFTPNTPQSDLDLDGVGDACDQDIDGDGVANALDNCPRNPSPLRLDQDNDGLGDPCDPDLDGDGIFNELDNCVRVTNTDQADSNDNGIGDACDRDLDQDGILDGIDNCPSISNPTQLDFDQDGIGDLCDEDPDNDGIIGDADLCPLTPSRITSDLDGDGIGDACDQDLDGDQITNSLDNCPRTLNPNQTDLDEDGVGDLCDLDTDADGAIDDLDNCRLIYNATQADLDQDGRGDACDADIDGDGILNQDDTCPRLYGILQNDLDSDGSGDDCDPDDDNDGYNDALDNCPRLYNPAQVDVDRNGIGDLCDSDSDQDGFIDGMDNCPFTPNPEQIDLDGDNLGDPCDSDADSDGIIGSDDNCPYTPSLVLRDLDGDGLGDPCDLDDDGDGVEDLSDNCPFVANPEQLDSDQNGVGDECQADSDNDGINDSIDNCPYSANPDQHDLDQDGIGDHCDLDQDGDGVVNLDDNCPSDFSRSQRDRDADGLGDVCDSDLDGDRRPNDSDNCQDVPNNDQLDFDNDGVGDACDSDADNDGVPDEIDICPQVFDPNQEDLDEDQRGDACDTDIDGDLILNHLDNCPRLATANQSNVDSDNFGDACDDDMDGDGILNEMDNCPLTYNPTQEQNPSGERGLACDLDIDQDGVLDMDDLCPEVYDPNQQDLDGDMIGDECDRDIDNDGAPNSVDTCPLVYNPSQDDPYLAGEGLACAGGDADQPILVFNELINGQLNTAQRRDLRSGNCGGQGAPEVAYRLQLAQNEQIIVTVNAEHSTTISLWIDGAEIICSNTELSYTSDQAQLVDIVIDGQASGDEGWVVTSIERLSVELSSRYQKDFSFGDQHPSDFMAVDLDHDGIDELITLDIDSQNLSYWRSPVINSEVEQRLPTEMTPSTLQIGQLLGDENDDVVTLNVGSHSISVFESLGAEGLNTPIHYDLFVSPIDLATIDLDQDGQHEILILDEDGGLHLYSFTEIGISLIGQSSTQGLGERLSVGDYNGDTWPDITVLNTAENRLTIYWGDGLLSFNESSQYSVPSNADSVTTKDLDHDGLDDIIIFSHQGLYAYFMYSKLEVDDSFSHDIAQLDFIGEQTAPLVADINEDGLEDLLVFRKYDSRRALEPTIYIQISGRLWRQAYIPNTGDLHLVSPMRGRFMSALADTNGDGQRELYFEAFEDPKLYWVYLSANKLFDSEINGEVSTNNTPRIWSKGDLNGDGLTDFVMPDDGEVIISLSDPKGLYKAPIAYATGYITTWTHIADFDGDDRADLLMLAEGKLYFGKGNGGNAEGLLETAVELFDLGDTHHITVDDIDQDGLFDLIVSYRSEPFKIYFGDNTQLFTAPIDSDVNAYRLSLPTVIDVDFDGVFELIIQDYITASSTCEVTREEISCTRNSSGLLMRSGTRTDLDQDGVNDLVYLPGDFYEQRILYNGSPSESWHIAPLPDDYTLPKLIDLNGDGALDLINFRVNEVGIVYSYQNAPRQYTPVIRQLRRGGTNNYPTLTISEDLNRDGRDDLTVLNARSNVFWISAPSQYFGHRDNDGLGVSSRLLSTTSSTLPLCSSLQAEGITLNGSDVEFEIVGDPCRVARVSISIEGEGDKPARWTLSAPDLPVNSGIDGVTFYYGNEKPLGSGLWTGRELPRLNYFEGVEGTGTWRLSLTHGLCENEPCSYLPSLQRINLYINAPIEDLSLAQNCSAETLEETCTWNSTELDLTLDGPNQIRQLVIPMGEPLTEQRIDISGATRDDMTAQLFLAGAQIPMTMARSSDNGLVLTWSSEIKNRHRALILKLKSTPRHEGSVAITLNRSED